MKLPQKFSFQIKSHIFLYLCDLGCLGYTFKKCIISPQCEMLSLIDRKCWQTPAHEYFLKDETTCRSTVSVNHRSASEHPHHQCTVTDWSKHSSIRLSATQVQTAGSLWIVCSSCRENKANIKKTWPFTWLYRSPVIEYLTGWKSWEVQHVKRPHFSCLENPWVNLWFAENAEEFKTSHSLHA